MGRDALRRPRIAIALWVLAVVGCRPDDQPAASGETEASSGGVEGSSSAGASPTLCVPGQSRACYEGPPGTEGVGACAAGQQQCDASGEAWSACAGEVWPEPQERCDTAQDDDCDGLALCEPTLEWWQPQSWTVNHVIPGEAGGAVLVGIGNGAPRDGGPGGLFVQALDAEGDVVWDRAGSSSGFQWPSAAAVGPAGDIIVAGTYTGSPRFGGDPLPEASGYDAFAVRFTSEGEHVWSHAIDSDGYLAATMDDEGTTYLVGGSLGADEVRGPVDADVFVSAVDASGALAWIVSGRTTYAVSEGTVSLVVTDAGELALGLVAGGPDFELGGMSMATESFEPMMVRIGLDGSPLGYLRMSETDPAAAGQVRVFARPGGLMAVASVWTQIGGINAASLLLLGMDDALGPLSRGFVSGQNVWLQAAATQLDGTLVIGSQFSGLLELGPIGVGVQGGTYGSVIAAVDEAGQARWAEVVYSNSYAEIAALAVGSDGAVYFVADVQDGGVIADVAVFGTVVGKLRP